MSFVGYFSTALSGLNAQSQALGAISTNIANSTTTGYRKVETNFEALVTEATADVYHSGGVIASPIYRNTLAGTTESTGITTNMAIAGNGFFVTSKATDVNGSVVSFEDLPYYTRAGDFEVDGNGYLVNGSGYYAQGFTVDPNTGRATGALDEIRVGTQVLAPSASASVTYRADLPADAAAGAQPVNSVDVFDSLGASHALELTWTKTGDNAWNLDIAAPDDTDGTTTSQTYAVTFDGNGKLASVSPSPVAINVTFPGASAQTITVDLGAVGSADAVTQYAGTSIDLGNLEADGYGAGGFKSLTIDGQGYVTVNYDNGESVVAYQIALARFNAAQNLQSEDGQAFTETAYSGAALIGKPGESGLGSLIGSAVESSNVDVGEEFTSLITTQRAYSANAKVLTTVDEMLQEILNVKR
ncbi:flagellar hook protein FlgE [Zavarzinia compransoris]|uniref:flagellar hook protein FlgE n=1 Tax=Zavarzinia marina TaxID=2911065 RepID=UPI001F3E238F|nr:flagellar hook protein FlgE [Zavarzinia marina]MCF4164168.1 flagellar hook protein FlgE [Zavarzinia marina]